MSYVSDELNILRFRPCVQGLEGVGRFGALCDVTLTDLLHDLLSHTEAPALDRWFSAHSRRQQWGLARQKALWDQLRLLLVRAGQLEAIADLGPDAGWNGFCGVLRHRLHPWVKLLDAPEGRQRVHPGVPTWLQESWRDRASREGWSSEVLEQLARQAETPCPWHLRFTTSPVGQEARAVLRARALLNEHGPLTAEYRGTGEVLAPFLKAGSVQTQDAASQETLNELDLRPGQRVWDVCAGNGGKTLLAAEMLANKGALIATDVSETKLQRLRQRVRVSGWQNVRILPWSGDHLPSFSTEIAGRGGFDRVFVDAPCSASGTWRRDPEARWRLTRAQLEDLGRHQRRLVRLGWSALRPGGSLAYITCSWLPAENELVAEEFSQVVGLAPRFQKLLGPPELNSNWMFVAVWTRAPS